MDSIEDLSRTGQSFDPFTNETRERYTMLRALVISLDFELHWGVRDHYSTDGEYRANLLGARSAVSGILELFDEFNVAATWATVGFLFAESKAELQLFLPRIRPSYADVRLEPYAEPIGECEDDDPLHYAPSLLRKIQRHNRQEIGTHTFSHYYCLEPGQTQTSFEADLDSAVRLARKRGITLRSIVFPRNQVNRFYLTALPRFGLDTYRGPQPGWLHNPNPRKSNRLVRRALRLAEHFVPIPQAPVFPSRHHRESSGVHNIPASTFLRPFHSRLDVIDPLRLARIRNCLYSAAKHGGIFHLWWHPHNFGNHLHQNLLFLRQVLQTFQDCRLKYGMQSLSMCEAADAIAAAAARRNVA